LLTQKAHAERYDCRFSGHVGEPFPPIALLMHRRCAFFLPGGHKLFTQLAEFPIFVITPSGLVESKRGGLNQLHEPPELILFY
jgi:hypothetical protein